MPCPNCAPEAWKPALIAEAFAIARCAICGLARTLPVPAESDGREHFAEDEAYYRRFYTEQRELRYVFTARMLRVKREFKAAGRILDIGCGLGFFPDYARRHGYECVGIDTSPAATRFARQHLLLDVIAVAFMDARFGSSETFDVVTANHVLEHFSEPVPFLEKAGRLLGRRWYGLQPSQRVWQFTLASYRALFQMAGLRVERTRIGSMHYAPGPNWKGTVIFCMAKLATAIGQGDNFVVVARGSDG